MFHVESTPSKQTFTIGGINLRARLKTVISSTGIIVVVAFSVRMILLFTYYHMSQQSMIRDNAQFGAEMGSVAAAIAAGRGFSSPLFKNPSGPTAWFTPMYPYLLGAIFKLFGIFSYPSGLIIRTIDIAFSAFTCWPILDIGTRIFGKTTGKAAAWAWVFLPSSIFFSVVWVWDSSLAALWMALLFAATLRLRGSDRPLWWIGYGALWAVGALINPSLISVLPFLALWAIWPLIPDLARVAKLTAVTSLVFIACIAPWTIRNYVVFHKLIPLRSNFGLELWLGNNPAVVGTWSPELHPSDSPEEASKYVHMTEIPYMEEKQREAIHFIRTHPADTAQLVLHRFADNWISMGESPIDVWGHSPFYQKMFLLWPSYFRYWLCSGSFSLIVPEKKLRCHLLW